MPLTSYNVAIRYFPIRAVPQFQDFSHKTHVIVTDYCQS